MGVAQQEHEASARIGLAHYVAAWGALLALALASFLLSRAGLPEPWSLIVALVIAAVKAALVLLIFMHLWAHRGASRLALGVATTFIVALILLTIADLATRFPIANPPESPRARARLESLPPPPWTPEPNQEPDRQPHYRNP